MTKRILTVSPNVTLARLIEVNLTRHGYAVDKAFTVADAWERFRAAKPDLIVLDRRLEESASGLREEATADSIAVKVI
jgi:DNA-binding response OmpR family regulator